MSNNSITGEMIIGKETIANGIDIVFEAAPKDIIFPRKYFLNEDETDIHIEMLINWAPRTLTGSPIGGFIPYLKVYAEIQNSEGELSNTELTPHLNISDNFHYAQNINLPGKISDLYDLKITIIPPKNNELGIHYDWNEKYGVLLEKQTFIYKDLSFEEIANTTRR